MPTTNQFHLYPLAQIIVPEDRQRKDLGDIAELVSSLRTIGLLNALVVKQDGTLIAGERRLRAAQELGWEKIPVHFYEELSKDELRLAELEENIKRKALDWKEECLAVRSYIEIRRALGFPHSFRDCELASGIDHNYIMKCSAVAAEISQNNQRIISAGSTNAAYNMIRRQHDRIVDTELSKMDMSGVFKEPEEVELDVEGAVSTPSSKLVYTVRPGSEDIKEGNFLSWVPSYRGPRFNFIHCDFPYGINLQDSEQANIAAGDEYQDDPETFWRLTEEFFIQKNKFMLPSCHIMFWFSMNYYSKLIEYIETSNETSDFNVQPHPLVWHKSDGRGILPDPARGPRRTYETALILSRGDRKIVQSVTSSYSAPTARALGSHPSHKPEPVLRHFFRMFVDSLSEVFDPTCGSGSALVAADELGANSVLGFDLSANYVEIAQENLTRSRRLRYAQARVQDPSV